MAKKKPIEQQIAEAERQLEVCKNREQRLKNRERYYRKAADRKRTHRLIQYGAAFESHHKELSSLSTTEIYSLIERLMDIPEVEAVIRDAVRKHQMDATDQADAPDQDEEGGS